MQDIIDELIEKEYWVLDILPEQVPAESPGQYFAIEEYYLKPPNIDRIYEKFADILLKLNCYFDFSVIFGDDERIKNPEPELLGEMVKNCLPDKDSGGKYVCILIEEEETLITLTGGDLYMTVYDPSERIMEYINALAQSEGLFFRKPLQ